MRYLDVCAGISASTVAWKPLGWKAAAYSEIEAAPRAILTHHYPDTPLHGDFTTIRGDEYGPIDLLVGGTPCQDFSVAGLRAGLDGERGNLSLEYLRLADRARPRWLVWENVPGVLSIAGGRAFGAILGGLGQLGYGFAYAILDAQHFGVPQRRRRVFVVGYLGDWRRAAAVLFERHSLSGHPAPRREAGQGFAGRVARSLAIRGREGHSSAELGDELANAILTPSGGRAGIGVGAALISSTGETAYCLNAGGIGRQDYETETLIAHAAVAFTCKDHGQDAGNVAPTLRSMGGTQPNGGGQVAVAFSVSQNANGFAWESEINPTLQARAQSAASNQFDGIRAGYAIRRLTPRECERLQGFPDDYTLVPYRKGMMADGPRYKALGNSMAVPVMRWIGERIAMVENLRQKAQAA